MTLKFYSRVAKGLKLKAIEFTSLIREVTGEKLVAEPFFLSKFSIEFKHISVVEIWFS